MTTPLPIVSGRYFLPKAPLVWRKRMPAAVVTSVKVRPGAAAWAAARGSGHVAAARPAAAATSRIRANMRTGGLASGRRLAAGNRGREHHAAIPAELLQAGLCREVGF